MTQITANGHTYSDDRTAARDMNDGGHRTWLLPMLSDVLAAMSGSSAEAAAASASAAAAAASAVTAASAAAGITGTSGSSLAIGTGSKTFATQAGKQWTAGMWVMAIGASSSNWMFGQVTSYASTSLVVDVTATGGSGTLSSWTITVAGVRGATGSPGPSSVQTRSTKTATYQLVAGDSGNLIDFTSGTYDVTFDPISSLSAGWWCEIRNSGTGVLTLNPNSSETIDGLTSFKMYPGEHRKVFYNGTALTSAVIKAFFATFTANDTFVKPPGYNAFGGLAWGSGGGGAKGSAAPGGGGGACTPFTLLASSLGATESITIGAGGAGSTTATPTAGNATTLGALVRAGGARAATSINGGVSGFFSTQAAIMESFSGYEYSSAGAGGPTTWGGGDGTSSTYSFTMWGGGGGAKESGSVLPSVFGGQGGAAGTSGVGSGGAAPGGGGGATNTGANGGAGARGELRIWGIA